jgi:cyclin A
MSGAQENCVRITRARAAYGSKAVAAAVIQSQADEKKSRKRAPKRAAVDDLAANESGFQPKRRAVLGDVTNLHAPAIDCLAEAKHQVDAPNPNIKGRARNKKKEARTLTKTVKAEIHPELDPFADHSSNHSECQKPPAAKLAEQRSLPGVPPKAKQGESSNTESRSKHTDIDKDHTDPQMCTTYVEDIYKYLRNAELKSRPSANFMDTVQNDITPNMRGILVDWLIEVSEEYKLVPDTLYLTVSYIDRYLSANPTSRHKLQLLGVSCMLIASKYEEVCPPQVEEFCYITDNTYTREEMLSMERKILTFLNFDMTIPTTKSFLRRFVRASQAGNKSPTLHMEFLANYLAELTLMECGFLQYLPSLIAASTVFLSRLTLDFITHPWNPTLAHYTGYKASQLKECVMAIYNVQMNRKGSTLVAIREKYQQHKFKCVASLPPPPFISERFFEDTPN